MICPLEDCDGQVARTEHDDAEFVIYRCGACDTEWASHLRTADSSVRAVSYLEQAGIPTKFRGLRFEENEHNKSALLVCRAWVADFEKGPLPTPALFGMPGRGKTHLLAAICSRLIKEKGARVLFRSARQLLRELQNFEDEKARQAAWRAMTEVQVLALDDLGAQQETDWRNDQLADLVDERYQNERPILVASNFKPSSWGQMLDSRTASRLAAMVLPVELHGPDRRQLELAS